MLEYDNSAFYYFALTILGFYIVPATYYVLRDFFSALFFAGGKAATGDARTSSEVKKVKKLKSDNSIMNRVCTRGFMCQLVFAVIAWTMFLSILTLLEVDSEIATFDPYNILGIEAGASDREIKKAYRAASLKYHPDKNPGDSHAEAMFVMVAKANEALTDDVARANYEKYGNPDGRQSMAVSLGLPTFLMEKENHKLILLVYLIILVVVIPTVTALWYNKSKRYGDNNVMYATYGFYNHALSEHAHMKMMPEVFSGSAEFASIPLRRELNEVLQKLSRTLKSSDLMLNPRFKHPLVVKPNMLLHAHLLRMTHTLPKPLQNDITAMLKEAPRLLDAMIELTTQRSWLQTTVCVIKFLQMVTQAMWIKDHPLKQLPHFTDQEVKHVLTGKQGVNTMVDYCRSENKKGLAKFTPEQVADVETVCKLIPDIDWEVTLGVDDEDVAAAGDVLTATVKITRNHVAEGEMAGQVHAPFFPTPRTENWYLMIGQPTGQLITLKRVTDLSRVVEEKVRFMGPPKAGKWKFVCVLLSDCYLGVDKQANLEIDLVARETLPKFEPHPDDVALDNEPTLFGQMMDGVQDDDSESDDVDNLSDSDDEDAAEKKKDDKKQGKEEKKGDEVMVEKKEETGGAKQRKGAKFEEE